MAADRLDRRNAGIGPIEHELTMHLEQAREPQTHSGRKN